MILVKISQIPGSSESEEVCELVELFQNEDGEYTSFSQPFITGPDDLELAHFDVKKDGVNRWFYENGKFSWSTEFSFWDWKRDE